MSAENVFGTLLQPNPPPVLPLGVVLLLFLLQEKKFVKTSGNAKTMIRFLMI
jgi:hypothetical protein